jgi:hypothetical protein
MTDVDRLLREYIEEHRAGGEADPLAYVERLEGTDRAELEALIDAYLARAPGRDWDPEAYRGSPAEQVVAALTESLGGVSGSWPVLLPELRNRARIRRDELVGRLADALGVGGREEKVAYYYNQMEHGLLEPAGVSDRVLDALAAIVDTTRDALRRAGQRVAPPAAAEGAVFARTAHPDADHLAAYAPRGQASPARGAGPERDEVDELFLGG